MGLHAFSRILPISKFQGFKSSLTSSYCKARERVYARKWPVMQCSWRRKRKKWHVSVFCKCTLLKLKINCKYLYNVFCYHTLYRNQRFLPFLAVINKFLNYFGQKLVSDFVWVYPPAKTWSSFFAETWREEEKGGMVRYEVWKYRFTEALMLSPGRMLKATEITLQCFVVFFCMRVLHCTGSWELVQGLQKYTLVQMLYIITSVSRQTFI